jgi:hypothetical protein
MMARASRPVPVLVAVAALGAGVLVTAGGPAAQAAPAAGQASPVLSPAPIPGSLAGVSADSATDAWAVGHYVTSAGAGQALIVHWNGTAWSQVPSPNPGRENYDLIYDVSAVSATDAWAVGTYEVDTPTGLANRTLLLRWNGTAWSKVKVPGGASTSLHEVSAVSGTDAWAVGSSYDKTTNSLATLAVHWNGTAWSRAATQNPPLDPVLSSVSTVSGTDAWATGALTMRWNGTSWLPMILPPLGRAGLYPTGISAVSGTNAWLVGWNKAVTEFAPRRTVILHSNGTTWKRVPSPNPGTSGGEGTSQLFGVDAISGTSAWAVGTYADPATGAYEALILHWNGTAWSVM